jgi:hypothetical protein
LKKRSAKLRPGTAGYGVNGNDSIFSLKDGNLPAPETVNAFGRDSKAASYFESRQLAR